jgi:hypothetical protein
MWTHAVPSTEIGAEIVERLWLAKMSNSGPPETGKADGGRGGIRTHGTLAGTPVFKTGALNHSATLPAQELRALADRFTR